MSGRSYVVGLPVVVTVEDDGTVTYELDTSEVTGKNGISAHWSEDEELDWSEARMLLDCAIIDAERLPLAHGLTLRLPARAGILGFRCPVTYGCGATTGSISEMATHIATVHPTAP